MFFHSIGVLERPVAVLQVYLVERYVVHLR
jgi:hypothetical protein